MAATILLGNGVGKGIFFFGDPDMLLTCYTILTETKNSSCGIMGYYPDQHR